MKQLRGLGSQADACLPSTQSSSPSPPLTPYTRSRCKQPCLPRSRPSKGCVLLTKKSHPPVSCMQHGEGESARAVQFNPKPQVLKTPKTHLNVALRSIQASIEGGMRGRTLRAVCRNIESSKIQNTHLNVALRSIQASMKGGMGRERAASCPRRHSRMSQSVHVAKTARLGGDCAGWPPLAAAVAAEVPVREPTAVVTLLSSLLVTKTKFFSCCNFCVGECMRRFGVRIKSKSKTPPATDLYRCEL